MEGHGTAQVLEAQGFRVNRKLGLGGTLIGIGILLTVGKEGVIDRMGLRATGSLLRWAPVLSALLVSAVGAWFTWQSFVESQGVIAQMLRAFAIWLES